MCHGITPQALLSALVGRADLMEAIAFDNRYGKKMRHPGTYNGNPLSAAAGCAALDSTAPVVRVIACSSEGSGPTTSMPRTSR